MIRSLLVLLSATSAQADVVFIDKSHNLPTHSYTGGWEHFVGGGLAILDCNGDDLPDVYAAGGTTQAALWINESAFSFRSGDIAPLTGVVGAYPIDLDNDKYLDLYVLRVGQNVALKGGPDCDFSQEIPLPTQDAWSTAFTAWWDGDAPSMAIGNYVDRSDPEGPFEACDANSLLEPDADGYSLTPLAPGFCALSMLAGPDARGRLALRISNDRHYYVRGGYEQMWDIQDRRFLKEADGWPEVSLWGMGIGSVDLTGDGVDEVMLTSMGDQLLQLPQPDGSYANAPYAIGTYAQRPHTGGDGRPSTGWHAEFGDIDNDGRADLFIAKGNVDQMPGMAMQDPNNLLMQQTDGSFVEVAETAGIATLERSRGAALVDFDGDGRLDLIVLNRRAAPELYANATPKAGNWLAIDLSQEGSNYNAVGASIEVRTSLGNQIRHRRIGGGHAGGQLLPIHFGLGKAREAQVIVTWPDGQITEHQTDGNTTLRVSRP